MPDTLPQHPFWTYSLRLYAQPGVSDACLKLQDEHGLDVNLVLFCIWCGIEGPGELTAEELSTAVARAARWQTEVVERIRYIRRALKEDALGADAELAKIFRPKVQALELEGEHVEQLTLAALVPEERGDRGQAPAAANLRGYLDSCGACEGDAAAELARGILATAVAAA